MVQSGEGVEKSAPIPVPTGTILVHNDRGPTAMVTSPLLSISYLTTVELTGYEPNTGVDIVCLCCCSYLLPLGVDLVCPLATAITTTTPSSTHLFLFC